MFVGCTEKITSNQEDVSNPKKTSERNLHNQILFDLLENFDYSTFENNVSSYVSNNLDSTTVTLSDVNSILENQIIIKPFIDQLKQSIAKNTQMTSQEIDAFVDDSHEELINTPLNNIYNWNFLEMCVNSSTFYTDTIIDSKNLTQDEKDLLVPLVYKQGDALINELEYLEQTLKSYYAKDFVRFWKEDALFWDYDHLEFKIFDESNLISYSSIITTDQLRDMVNWRVKVDAGARAGFLDNYPGYPYPSPGMNSGIEDLADISAAHHSAVAWIGRYALYVSLTVIGLI